MDLKFRVETAPNGARIKVRDDGRRGPCVADEAVLWDALRESEAENAELRGQLSAAAERVAAQSEALTRKAEKRK